MPHGARVGLYYAPQEDDPLFAASESWLGRNPVSGAAAAQPDLPGIAGVTADPGLYGFHATLKPPFGFKTGVSWFDVVATVRAVARWIAPFDLPPLAVTDLRGFLALTETIPCAALQGLADACVAGLDDCREPASADALARRRRARLTDQQDTMLERWGYPYVFETWTFHMTLTQRLGEAEKGFWFDAAKRHFAAAVAVPRRVTDICLFTQPGPGVPFVIAERIALRG